MLFSFVVKCCLLVVVCDCLRFDVVCSAFFAICFLSIFFAFSYVICCLLLVFVLCAWFCVVFPFVLSDSLPVVCGLLFVDRCSLIVVRCVLFVVC